MKDFIKTAICSLVILIIIVLSFLIVSNVEQGIELLTRSELPKTDPDVKILYGQIENNTDLRKAHMKVEELTYDEIITLVMDNLSKDDYTKKTIEAEKIVCEVPKKIHFNTDSKKCNVRIIKTSVFTNYLKNNFNLDKEIDFKDFNYLGYNCRIDGKKYYCLYNSKKEYVQGYSIFDSAYRTKDTIVISEYYLQVDLADSKRCKTYFDEEYCANYKEEKRKELKETTIRKDGVLYEHVFKLVNGKYYLQESYVKSEG